ncbi:7-carboxy-7-deazaguanine synthase QueE [Paenibacillus sp. UNC499MF]|uniref:7-carboxy-7-deazaguanine synthase QueE n=1 Tax=Paenibacillus sp. UNC499MF TaxID=1502751 RepID=UPI00089FE86A|nr:7-carboxy-7-deazaguanine synthase QueE [Paenibacillus sp. UNC499MF]SEF81728.1 7-carboxy-7-deazaguanine synthase [Paenibacillus sp. UNC499MF]
MSASRTYAAVPSPPQTLPAAGNTTAVSAAPADKTTPAEATIPVLEIFGPTVQGEGMVIGRKTMFVRTAGCDYRCSWCDSAFTWDGSGAGDIRPLTAEAVWEELVRTGGSRFSHVTLSGGNPALLRSLGPLVKLLRAQGIRTAVETQGSRWQDWLTEIDEVTLSPKPPSSGMETDFAKLDDIVRRLNPDGISLKVVVFDERDFAFAREVHRRYPAVPFYLQAGNEDVRLADDDLLRGQLLRKYEWLVDLTMASEDLNDVRVLPQLHALLWGNKRGV